MYFSMNLLSKVFRITTMGIILQIRGCCVAGEIIYGKIEISLHN